jgi:hypothetical protein
MKAYGAVHVEIHIFMTPALIAGEWSNSRPGRFTHRSHWIADWVGPKAGMDDVEKRKFFTLSGLEFRPLGCPLKESLKEISCWLH